MHPLYRLSLLLICTTISVHSLIAQNPVPQWTHFRGSNLNGISSESGLPTTWNDSSHIQWKTPIAGKGWSSPVVYGNQVWLTTEENKEMRAICYDFQTGKIIHNKIVFNPDTLYRKHSINTYATPTPAIDEGFVYQQIPLAVIPDPPFERILPPEWAELKVTKEGPTVSSVGFSTGGVSNDRDFPYSVTPSPDA